jgi:hypothetical protein
MNVNEQRFGKFLGTWNHYAQLTTNLNWEAQERLYGKHRGDMMAEVQIRNVGKCFGDCVKSVDEQSLNPAEKNCLRECFFRRMNAKDDFQIYVQEKFAANRMKQVKETFV